MWPNQPEIPRYRFAGQLTGWENFRIAEEEVPKGLRKAAFLIVGLDPETGLAQENARKSLRRPQTGLVDAAGRILITDSGHRGVVVFDQPTGKFYLWQKADAVNLFSSPVGIALGRGNEYLVADAELGRVVRLDSQGEPVGDFGRDYLVRPTGLARDPARGMVYVADTRSQSIKVFSDDGKHVKTIGGPGTENGNFNGPTHIAYGRNRLYVTDTLNARVQVFDTEGEFLFAIGRRGILVGEMVRPKGVTVDAEGNIYVVESFHDHLLIFNKDGQFLMPIGGTGKEVGNFYLPSGVWSDAQGRVFVADMFNGRVTVFQYLGGQG
ncbi:MAG: 6-bladed beta-propeller [Magnetococcales bacterium]|nr:6-bladed beta-propeller [Magnetococcales bacterium]